MDIFYAGIGGQMQAWAILAAVAAAASGQGRESIDAFVTRELQARRIPGAAVAVVDRGAVTFQNVYGIANMESDTPVRLNSVFQLASLTKQFTSAAVMMLVEEGKIGLDH